ncbi:MAG TPA: Clp protease N-terminal domain-containing protein [Candidatus Dormibacteraeota bacterium]|nr:Clp protease N-terminal domain-containing protein [Candidatus Dormibacteraeota bacterium]
MSQYPFERFSENAKRTLVLAQDEAERARRTYIGTEHMLLGLFRLGSGSGHRALVNLAVDSGSVRRMIDETRNLIERPVVKQVIPTSRVKRVIEIAFDESDRMGKQQVESGHLLIGLAIEGEGIAAHVLRDFGASAERVVAEVERELGMPPRATGKQPSRGAINISEPPPNITALRDKLASVKFVLRQAVAARDTEHALKLGGEESRLERELAQAENAWLNSVG